MMLRTVLHRPLTASSATRVHLPGDLSSLDVGPQEYPHVIPHAATLSQVTELATSMSGSKPVQPYPCALDETVTAAPREITPSQPHSHPAPHLCDWTYSAKLIPWKSSATIQTCLTSLGRILNLGRHLKW